MDFPPERLLSQTFAIHNHIASKNSWFNLNLWLVSDIVYLLSLSVIFFLFKIFSLSKNKPLGLSQPQTYITLAVFEVFSRYVALGEQFIFLVNRYLLSTGYMPNTDLGAWDTSVNKTEQKALPL